MDWNDRGCAGSSGRFGGGAGIQVAGTERGSPAPDGNKRDVDRSERCHAVEEIRIAREVHRARAVDHVPHGRRASPERRPPRIVERRGASYRKCADSKLVADGELGHRAEPLSLDQVPRPSRHHYGNVTTELLQGRKVEVVEVNVRDEYGIDVTQDFRGDLTYATEVQESGTKKRVGQEPHALHLYENGRVPDVDDSGGSCGHWPPSYASAPGGCLVPTSAVHSFHMSYALKLAAAAIAFLIAGVIAILVLEAVWLRIGFGAALVVLCGGLLLFAWRVDKKEKDARAGLDDLPNV